MPISLNSGWKNQEGTFFTHAADWLAGLAA